MKTLITNHKCLAFMVTFLIACSVRNISYGGGATGTIIDISRTVGGAIGDAVGVLVPGGGIDVGGSGVSITYTGNCQVGDILAPEEGCTYPGTDTLFFVLSNGSGQFVNFNDDDEIYLRNTNIDGRSYTIVASKLGDGSWEIQEIGTTGKIVITEIMFGSRERFTPPQWIELYNAGTDPVWLTGWTLTIQNWASPDLTGPVNATIAFKRRVIRGGTTREFIEWYLREGGLSGDGGTLLDLANYAPLIFPNETVVLVSGNAYENSGNLSEEQIYDLYWRHPKLDLGFWDTILSAEGFYLKLIDSAGNLVDEAGNFDGNVLHWQLPFGANRGRNRVGHRVSIIRRYVNDMPLDGTLVDSWISAEDVNLTADQLTHYGDKYDISSPGIGPFAAIPAVDCQVGAILVPGQSCTYPGTNVAFSVLNNGDGRFLFRTTTEFNLINTNIEGQSYTLVANKRGDGSWIIEEVGAVEKPAAVNPKGRKWILWGQLKASHEIKHQ